ncbi:tRNA pseudouridine(55) synthase TruB [Candidatus Saccharibacteria bacterium 32-49-12]|nr:MAG: tRNA pseudouridine(55) synthase TruB [Candidatus Saccharibacteria bacterium 32-49-12]
MQNDSIILVDKPAGLTSFGVVARVRRVLSEQLGKKAKVGHTGTLDPFATGLMIIVTGVKCREAMTFSKLDKEYEAVIELGKTSSTGDPEGELTLVDSRVPTLEEVQAAAVKFTGQIEQTPPQFSAIKINGQRAYKLARKGQVVEMPKRQVTIYELEVISYDYPDVKIRVRVSSGTYIRTLAEDIGSELGVGAYCRELRRTRVGEWSVEDAIATPRLHQ